MEVAPTDVIWANLGLNPYEQKVSYRNLRSSRTCVHTRTNTCAGRCVAVSIGQCIYVTICVYMRDLCASLHHLSVHLSVAAVVRDCPPYSLSLPALTRNPRMHSTLLHLLTYCTPFRFELLSAMLLLLVLSSSGLSLVRELWHAAWAYI